MPSTATDTLTNVRFQLDDPNATRWTNAELILYINDACKKIAKIAEILQGYVETPVATQQFTLPAPSQMCRIFRMQFIPYSAGSPPQQCYPLEFRSLNAMDAIWGINQTLPSAYPTFYSLRGNPPNLQIILFPVPAQPGYLTIDYYRLPNPVVNVGDLLDIPEGYDDLIRLYVEYRALRSDHNPSWTDSKAEFDEGLTDMIDKTRTYADAAGFISTGGSRIPGWLLSLIHI